MSTLHINVPYTLGIMTGIGLYIVEFVWRTITNAFRVTTYLLLGLVVWLAYTDLELLRQIMLTTPQEGIRAMISTIVQAALVIGALYAVFRTGSRPRALPYKLGA